jgi:heme exporter protein A
MRIIVERLAVERGGRRVLGPVDFAAEPGQALILKGPNGAGKTSLIRVLAGLAQAADGTIRLEGAIPDTTLGENAHYVGHANAVKPRLSVLENVRFWAQFLGGTQTSAHTAVEAFGLASLADVPAGWLSAGQRRRLGLARLLAAERTIWLLDEPTVSLDVASTRVLAELARTHLSRGGLLIAATHIDMGLEGAVLDVGRRSA